MGIPWHAESSPARTMLNGKSIRRRGSSTAGTVVAAAAAAAAAESSGGVTAAAGMGVSSFRLVRAPLLRSPLLAAPDLGAAAVASTMCRRRNSSVGPAPRGKSVRRRSTVEDDDEEEEEEEEEVEEAEWTLPERRLSSDRKRL